MTIRYAISIVSGLCVGYRGSLRPPGCFFISPEQTIKAMYELGFDGVQAIPIWDMEITEAIAEMILLSQGPWNAVPSLPAALRHEKGTLGVESNWRDWLISPPADVCAQMVEEMNAHGIRRISHDVNRTVGQLIELHPGLDMTVDEIISYCLRYNAG